MRTWKSRKIYLRRNERAKATQYLKQALRVKQDDITEGSRRKPNIC